jgi:TorA maturation chaperone TorD
VNETERQDKADEASYRSNVYGLLATVFRQEVTADFLRRIKDPQFLGVLSTLGIEFQSDFLEKPEEAVIEELAVEFAWLFLGPGKHISPHESVHHQRNNGKWGQLWGDATVAVKKFIEATGLNYDPAYKGLPDHISVELEFMEMLSRREAQAWLEGKAEEARRLLEVELRFSRDHLSRWVPSFCDKIVAAAELSFYRELAALTRRFIEFDLRELQDAVQLLNEACT